MRPWLALVESTFLLPATPANIQKAKAFLLAKWRERAAESGGSEPHDLSRACKFAALFAQAIFGGKIMANDHHTWVILDGRVLDLAEDAPDATLMRQGRLPEYAKEYANNFNLKVPEDGAFEVYKADPEFMRLAGFKESLKFNLPRINRWVDEFRWSV